MKCITLNPKLPKGPKVVPFGGSFIEFYKVIPKRNYFNGNAPSFGGKGRNCVQDACYTMFLHNDP